MQTAGLGSLVELTASASVDATLPLQVTIAGFDPTAYGQPVVVISGENFLTFDLARTPHFLLQRPDIAFDIRITAQARDALLGILDSLQQKVDGLASDLDGLLGFQIPGLGVSVGDLLKLNDILGAFDLKDVVEPYFAQYDFVATFPSLLGLIESLNTGVSKAASTTIDVLNAVNDKMNFAGFDAAEYFSAHSLLKDLRGFSFRGADLQGVDFTGFDLSGVDFSGADLRGAIFTDANLRGVNLTGTRLQGAVLDGAFAVGAIFKNAKIGTAPPPASPA